MQPRVRISEDVPMWYLIVLPEFEFSKYVRTLCFFFPNWLELSVLKKIENIFDARRIGILTFDSLDIQRLECENTWRTISTLGSKIGTDIFSSDLTCSSTLSFSLVLLLASVSRNEQIISKKNIHACFRATGTKGYCLRRLLFT